MYRVYANTDLVLLDPSLDDEKYMLLDAVLAEEANCIPSFTFKIHEGHAYYDQLDRFQTIIEVLSDSELIFRGRIIDTKKDYFNNLTCVCEGDLGYLNDYPIRPFRFPITDHDWSQGYVRGILDRILTEFNTFMPTHSITLRTVSVEDPLVWGELRDNNYLTAWEFIQKHLIDVLGGYLVFERSDGTNYLDYLKAPLYQSSQTIELTKNLIDCSMEVVGSDAYSCVVPLGKMDQDTKKRLTIESVAEGHDSIDDPVAIARFGRIEKVVIFDDVEDPGELYTLGEDVLNRDLISVIESITLTAADLSQIDGTLDGFRLIDKVRIEDEYHGTTGYMMVAKKTTSLIDVSKNTLTVGSNGPASLGKAVSRNRKVNEEIVRDYVINEQVADYESQITTMRSMIEQDAGRISMVVEETGEIGANLCDENGVSLIEEHDLFLAEEGTLQRSLKAAEIVTSINESGSTVKIAADKVDIEGDVVFKSNLTDGTTQISGANLIAGSITAAKLAAGSVTTDKIASNAGVVFTSNLTDGTTTISGDNIKTGTISAANIEIKDASNHVTFKANASGSDKGKIKLSGWDIDNDRMENIMTIHSRDYGIFFSQNANNTNLLAITRTDDYGDDEAVLSVQAGSSTNAKAHITFGDCGYDCRNSTEFQKGIGIEHGHIDNLTNSWVTVNFANTYRSVPSVVSSPSWHSGETLDSGDIPSIKIRNVTTTKFEICVASSTISPSVDWIAVGDKQ